MVEAWSIRAGLYAILAAAAFIAAGCSTVATVPEDEDTQDDEALVEEVELDPAATKIDEADIGVSGPEQIEEAIETLDAQTESSPPLVSSSGGVSAAPAVGDLFERIRTGFVIEDVEHDDDRPRRALVRESSVPISTAPSSAASATSTTSSSRSRRARCRSSSRCCRSSRARSIRSRTRGRALPVCGSSFPAPAAATT